MPFPRFALCGKAASSTWPACLWLRPGLGVGWGEVFIQTLEGLEDMPALGGPSLQEFSWPSGGGSELLSCSWEIFLKLGGGKVSSLARRLEAGALNHLQGAVLGMLGGTQG